MRRLFNMFSNIGFFMTALTLSLLMISLTFIGPAMASSKGGGSVTQEKVSTGDSGLDQQINKFYSCISKTHQDPPTIQIVDNCYSQNSVAGITGPGNHNNNNISNNNKNNNNDIIKTPLVRVPTPPPGVLVEIP